VYSTIRLERWGSLVCLCGGNESKTPALAIQRILPSRRTAEFRLFCPPSMTVNETSAAPPSHVVPNAMVSLALPRRDRSAEGLGELFRTRALEREG
jgi:hypothetical protein